MTLTSQVGVMNNMFDRHPEGLIVRSNTRNVHSSVTPSAALQLKDRLHPHEGI